MMISLLFSLLVSLTHWVMAQEQPLESAQHAVLMSVLDGLVCNATVCPRFSSSSNCTGSWLTCVGGKVTSLSLYDYQLTGTIASTIGQLTALTALSLSSNQVSGTIPSTMGQLTALTALGLSSNQLIGTIPLMIGQLTALAYLQLDNNQLIGTIPPLIAPLLICQLQFPTDTNCLDCSTGPAKCVCVPRVCSTTTTTTTMPKSTTLPTTTITPPSTESTSSLVPSSIDNVKTLSTSAVDTTAISTASTSALTETTIGANQTLQESHASAITMLATQSPADNIALIGGVVGGAVALLLIGALIAFCVVRSRRNNKEQPYADPSAHALQSRSPSNYGRIDGISGTANNPASSTYVDVVVGPPANYDAWSDTNDYTDSSLAERNHYEDFTKIH